MSNHIDIPTMNRLGGQLRQAIDDLSRAVSGLDRVRSIMEQCAADEDYAAVEKAFGLEEGTGRTVYNLVMASYKLTTYSEINQLITRMG